MADSSVHDSMETHSQQSPRRDGKKSDDLDARQTPKVPAWKLREQMKSEDRSIHPSRALPKASRHHDGGVDPSLPPAFRAAFARQHKKEVDDFMSMDSVHSTKSHLSTLMTATPSTVDSDSGLDDSESTFDGHDSFASLGEDDEDDEEAYREGRNQIAKQVVECTGLASRNVLKGNDFRLKKGGGVHGTPLDFIAE
jgi:hypothetical protein